MYAHAGDSLRGACSFSWAQRGQKPLPHGAAPLVRKSESSTADVPRGQNVTGTLFPDQWRPRGPFLSR